MKLLKNQWSVIILLSFISFQFVKGNVVHKLNFSPLSKKHHRIHRTEKIGDVVLNVKDFGALGNGTQDDYNAITKAINSVQTPVRIYFPAGTYLISHALVTTHDGIVFLFDNAKLSLPTATSGGIVLANDNCSVINAYIKGNGVSSPNIALGYGVLMSGVSNCKVLNSTFTNISGINIFLISHGNKGCSKCVVDGNHIRYPAFSRDISQDASCIMLGYSGTGYFHTNNVVSNNEVDGNGIIAHGIAIIAHGMDNAIISNHVINCLRYGIISYESKYEDYTLMRTTISHNIVENIGNPGGKASPYGMGIYLVQSHYSIVKNNRLNNCCINTDNSQTLPAGEISLNGATYSVVDSNIITNSHKNGIACAMTFHTDITNNTVDGTVQAGIYLINTATNIIKNNTIKNAGAYAIRGFFESTSKPNLLADMTIKKFQNISTGDGVEITNNKIYSNSPQVIYMTGEDPDPKSNYKGNALHNVSIHDNTFIGNSNPGSIRLDKAAPGLNNVVHNKFQ